LLHRIDFSILIGDVGKIDKSAGLTLGLTYQHFILLVIVSHITGRVDECAGNGALPSCLNLKISKSLTQTIAQSKGIYQYLVESLLRIDHKLARLFL
jgi:hypothetical protein